ncbi:sigma-54-dependent transcriptional regulator EatR [Paralimibaculum aggregatum]|uniref:Sigma-54-dependent transcriptional regulator EatR n=2 Tax=Paralimibaculum aggregatum TaxID=3036245 RepID=A0ABQ6LIS6_9RHOB|nr:sigma-54-dependent transcriptional regulator EatR [Limibaculum sp. NKW23]
MIGPGSETAIAASWERCERKHNLVRDAARPILRLQSTEIAPRFAELVERTGGRQGIIRQLAELAVGAGSCLVVADADGVLVRLESQDRVRADFESYGIALGSCWDERLAGTNGVSMAMAENAAFTVDGRGHYFSRLRGFACTGVPLFDAENRRIGALALSAFDRGNPAEHGFARLLLGTAADRIQRILFERRFAEQMIVTVSAPAEGALLQAEELVAVDEAGTILGSTARAHRLVGMEAPSELLGRSFEIVFGADAGALDRVPGRVLSTRFAAGPQLGLAARRPHAPAWPGRGWQPPAGQPGPARPRRRHLAPSYRELAIGSEAVADVCERAEAHFRRALPFVIEGESGTGKSALVAAIREAAGLSPAEAVTVDCALIGEFDDDRTYVRTVFQQARVVGALDMAGPRVAMLVLDNADEMPAYVQAGLRSLLAEIEAEGGLCTGEAPASAVRVVATCRRPLRAAVEAGAFRDDLFFLLAHTRLVLPPLRVRARPEALVRALATRLAGAEVEIAPEAMAAIAAHGWPGNVRELRSVLQQALMAGDGRRISPMELRGTSVLAAADRPAPETPAAPAPALPRPVYDERAMLLDALTGARWNVSQAARTLGMSRATIHRRMNRHGIARPS